MDVTGIFRVTVRGRFGELDSRARAFLDRHRTEHDIFLSAYTPEGTFVYDDRVQFFSLRYEVRTDGGSDAARATALGEAEQFLSTLGIPHRELKVTVVDTSAMWAAANQRSVTDAEA